MLLEKSIFNLFSRTSTSNTYIPPSHFYYNRARLIHRFIETVFNVPVETEVHPLRPAPADDSLALPRSNQPEYLDDLYFYTAYSEAVSMNHYVR